MKRRRLTGQGKLTDGQLPLKLCTIISTGPEPVPSSPAASTHLGGAADRLPRFQKPQNLGRFLLDFDVALVMATEQQYYHV